MACWGVIAGEVGIVPMNEGVGMCRKSYQLKKEGQGVNRTDGIKSQLTEKVEVFVPIWRNQHCDDWREMNLVVVIMWPWFFWHFFRPVFILFKVYLHIVKANFRACPHWAKLNLKYITNKWKFINLIVHSHRKTANSKEKIAFVQCEQPVRPRRKNVSSCENLYRQLNWSKWTKYGKLFRSSVVPCFSTSVTQHFNNRENFSKLM